jgi:hypothetical protein
LHKLVCRLWLYHYTLSKTSSQVLNTSTIIDNIVTLIISIFLVHFQK